MLQSLFFRQIQQEKGSNSFALAPREIVAKPLGMGLTVEQLQKIMPSLRKNKTEEYTPLLNSAMAEFEINTPQRRNMFIAQLAHESGDLKYMKELGNTAYFTKMYDITQNPKKAKSLGNLSPGDGAKYRGRGPIQVTGKNNYRMVGKELHLDLVEQPELLEEPIHAFRSSASWWKRNNVNQYIDSHPDDIEGVSGIVNRGSSKKIAKHLPERIKKYQLVKKVLGESTDSKLDPSVFYDEKRGMCLFFGSPTN